jgi:hypothetical protein
MPRPLIYPIKKLIGFDAELWENIRDYRFKARLNTESDAVRQLIEAGLSKAPAVAASGGSGSGRSSKPSTKPVPRPRKPAAPSRKAEPAAPISKLDQIRALREQGAR